MGGVYVIDLYLMYRFMNAHHYNKQILLLLLDFDRIQTNFLDGTCSEVSNNTPPRINVSICLYLFTHLNHHAFNTHSSKELICRSLIVCSPLYTVVPEF